MSNNSWLKKATEQLGKAGIESASYDARLLAEHALNVTRTDLLTTELEPTPAFWNMIAERARRIPLQHLIGWIEWGGITLKTDRRALIPRPETEVLLMMAATEYRRLQARGISPRIADVGTGSGALGLALTFETGATNVTLTDVSPEALALAAENAARLGLQVTLHDGYLLDGLDEFDLIVANLPYLPASDATHAQPEVTHDPLLALYAGEDGLTLARELVNMLDTHLSQQGSALLELDPRNVRLLAAELTHHWQAEIFPDLTMRERFLRIRRV